MQFILNLSLLILRQAASNLASKSVSPLEIYNFPSSSLLGGDVVNALPLLFVLPMVTNCSISNALVTIMAESGRSTLDICLIT